MKVTKQIETILEASTCREQLEETFEWLELLLDQYKIQPDELQLTMLLNHVDAMLVRSLNSEEMMRVDPQLFAEVSPEALQISTEVVQKIGNLSEAEKFILSIHFEAARINTNK